MAFIGYVPSEEFPDAGSALARFLPDAESVEVAVAFITQSGVEHLLSLSKRHPKTDFSVVARGAPITDPDALVKLAEYGVSVAVVAEHEAASFHPKLWLLRGPAGVYVLSGSGNLTAGGMGGNREQFEILHLTDAGDIEAQDHRLAELTRGAIPLELFQGSIAWRTWKEQLKERERLLRRVEALDQDLAESISIDRRPHTEQLMRDMWDVYRRTLDAKLKKDNGHIYNPSGLRLQLEGKRGPKEPVPIAASICKKGTDGFDTIKKSNRPDLTVEYLVVDTEKPYHDLFPEETRDLSAKRLREQFPDFFSD